MIVNLPKLLVLSKSISLKVLKYINLKKVAHNIERHMQVFKVKLEPCSSL